MKNEKELDIILKKFIDYEPPQIKEFNQALEKFKEDVPSIVQSFRELINEAGKHNSDYIKARNRFHELCKTEINPEIALEDIREMLIQHILTQDIFNAVFDETNFHRYNSIAKELEKVIDTFPHIVELFYHSQIHTDKFPEESN